MIFGGELNIICPSKLLTEVNKCKGLWGHLIQASLSLIENTDNSTVSTRYTIQSPMENVT